MKQILTMLIGGLWLLSQSAGAALVQGLYEARVPIAQQSVKVQKQAAREAMAQVLVKIKGNKDVLDSQVIQSKLGQAEDYIRQYRFDNEKGQGYFIASFDGDKIDDLVRAAGFAVWGNRRPSTLVWLAIENPDTRERTLISELRRTEETLGMLDAARNRGIILNFPLLDIEDLNRVGVFDVWGRFTGQLLAASERYEVEVMLSARMYQVEIADSEAQPAETQWQLDWNYVMPGLQQEGTLTAKTKEDILRELVNHHADILAMSFVGEGNEQGASLVELQFNNVSDLDTYVRITRILQSLSVVSHASLEQLSGSVGIFKVRLSGSEQGLINAIGLEDRIQRQRDQFGQPMEALQFNWVEL
ncbi:DUF2066 domain-containing protein [Lacimicrobium alkaliphilum]|uniref:DUF2066 domain-containing protein n=1 Tax=Lacimicrobium alkaliphilum TaxID=1526571 RepID=A0A0U2Z6A5_9ALTE|nr:DUF2066 domain-containing protein [Lacimicrobium alkaliphilum]ALS98435.1 hypothetical protein AT746_09310 [Lacimicrobium alkaliphilum]